MMTKLFDQFMIPEMCGIKLLPITILIPTLLIYAPNKIQTNRITSMIHWSMKKTTKHLLPGMNTPAQTWSIILMTTIMLISSINTVGLLPYTFTPTTQLSMNMAMATPLWLATITISLRNQPAHSLSHLLPQGTPTPLIPPLIIIETISLLIRPLALGIRLTANLTAGHLLIQLISTATMKTNLILFPPMFTTLLLLTTLEAAVAVIQAYVFTLLLGLYLQESTNE